MEPPRPYTTVQPPSPIVPILSQPSPELLVLPQSTPPASFESPHWHGGAAHASQPPDNASQRRPRETTLNPTPRSTPLRQLGRPPEARHATRVSGWPNESELEGGLSHLDVPRKFGEAADYWKFYEEVSDRQDNEMVKILGANIDILLIFVSRRWRGSLA